MSVKLQVVIPEDLARRTRAAAKREQVPMGQLIREGLEYRLRQSREEANQNFIDAITGICDLPDTDLAARADELLYGGQ